MCPMNLPDTTYEQVTAYLTDHNAGKAYKGGNSLLELSHISNIMTHTISSNIRYCFVRCMCCPEQKQSKDDYDMWICLHKDTGEIMTADCKCVAGASGVCVCWCTYVIYRKRSEVDFFYYRLFLTDQFFCRLFLIPFLPIRYVTSLPIHLTMLFNKLPKIGTYQPNFSSKR